MPEPTGCGSRALLPPANQALADLDQATGMSVMVVEAPQLTVLATIREAGPEDAAICCAFRGAATWQPTT